MIWNIGGHFLLNKCWNDCFYKLKSEFNINTAGELVENHNSENSKIDNENINNEENLFDNYELIFKEWLEENIKKFGPFNYSNALQTLSPSKLSDPIAEKWYEYLNSNQEKLRLKTNKIDEIERNIIELSMIVIGTVPTKNSYKKLKREDRTMVSLKSFIYRKIWNHLQNNSFKYQDDTSFFENVVNIIVFKL